MPKPKQYKPKTRRYAPKNANLAGRWFDKDNGDLLEIYAINDTIIVRVPKDELNISEYWKPPHRRKQNAKL